MPCTPAGDDVIKQVELHAAHLGTVEGGSAEADSALIEDDEFAHRQKRGKALIERKLEPLQDVTARAALEVYDRVRLGSGGLRREAGDMEPHLASRGYGAILRDYQVAAARSAPLGLSKRAVGLLENRGVAEGRVSGRRRGIGRRRVDGRTSGGRG